MSSPSTTDNLPERARSIRESLRFFDITLQQLDKAMQEGQYSVDALAGLFSELYGKLPPHRLTNDPSSLPTLAEVSEQLRHAILHLQFYDHLFQRVNQIQNSLKNYRNLLERPGAIDSGEEWQQFWEVMEANSLNAEDRRLLHGLPATAEEEIGEDTNGIELF
ncbi:MAG: hypothetical protein ABW148_13700 [Sedimenticola sp.]